VEFALPFSHPSLSYLSHNPSSSPILQLPTDSLLAFRLHFTVCSMQFHATHPPSITSTTVFLGYSEFFFNIWDTAAMLSERFMTRQHHYPDFTSSSSDVLDIRETSLTYSQKAYATNTRARTNTIASTTLQHRRRIRKNSSTPTLPIPPDSIRYNEMPEVRSLHDHTLTRLPHPPPPVSPPPTNSHSYPNI